MKMLRRNLIGLFLLMLAGCANPNPRFEKIENDKATTIPMTLNGLYGARNGDTVTAEAHFVNNNNGSFGNDVAQIKMQIHLGPPAEFVSGTYHTDIGGKVADGTVESLSLDFQGGQGDDPYVGGKFLLKPDYRVSFPATKLKRRR